MLDSKHVGTGSPKKNTAMDEISLSTTELGHLLSRVEAKSRLYMKIGVTRLNLEQNGLLFLHCCDSKSEVLGI